MGRTGKWFAFQHYGVEPDAFSLAKALASGYPIGAVVSSPKLSDVFQPGKHASTFGGTPLACAAALATIEVMEQENLVDRADKAGAKFMKLLKGFIGKYKHVVEVRGKGLMVGMALDQPVKPLTDMLAENGLLTLATAEKIVRFLPPLIVTDHEIEEAVGIVEKCLNQWIQQK